jgi:NDP-sugar pyrophosphorylase family protein
VKAMILAAGVGSRLRPLTDAMPKALVEVGGVTMLERAVRRLQKAGAKELIINVFHLADKIEAFLALKKNFGLRIELSRETTLLDTGGGLKNAAWFFDDGRPFLLHNVDVVSDLDLAALYQAHLEKPALATLAVRQRQTQRLLSFDEAGLLNETGSTRLAFDGVHVVSPDIFPKLTETGAFPVAAAYRRLAAAGETIRAYRADGSRWLDIGSAERLEEARLLAKELK